MPYITQIRAIIHSIRKNPGINIDDLYEIIKEKYSKNFYIDLMIQDSSTSQLLIRINDLNCIEKIDDKFYFNLDKKPYYKKLGLINDMLEYSIGMEKKDENKKIVDSENKF
jgi:hypothetical protein